MNMKFTAAMSKQVKEILKNKLRVVYIPASLIPSDLKVPNIVLIKESEKVSNSSANVFLAGSYIHEASA